MDFRILGSLEVVDEGRPVSIRRGKELALLAYLLLHANEIVPSERLVDELWDGRPPPTAPKILQNAVSHLRRALGEGRVVTRDPGYVLRVGDDELDLNRFQRLAEEGRSERDPAKLRAALGLWRGPALLDLREERFAEDARRRLDEERLAVLEDRIDADLAAGRDAELVHELEDLIGAHPLRERLDAQLMLALYRAGRQGEALEAYQRARKRLSEELGLQPSPQLHELERKILRQDPDLEAPARADRELGLPLLRTRPSMRLAFGAAAVIFLAAAAISLGLIFALDEDSAPLIAKRNSLVAIDPSRNRIVHVTEVGAAPRGVAVGNKNVWVANSADGTVSRVDAKTLRVVQTIGIGAQATELVTAAGALWVATGVDNTLVKIDARTGGLLATVSLPAAVDAAAYAVAAGHGATWVASGDRILKIGPRSNAILLGARRPFGCCGSVRDVALGLGAVWITTIDGVFRISESRGSPTGSVNLGVIPTTLTVGFGAVWVGSSGPSWPDLVIWRLDPQTLRVTRTISIGRTNGFIGTVDVAAGAGAVWATNYDEGTLVRIDPRTGNVDATIHIGRHPRGIAVGADRIWVAVG